MFRPDVPSKYHPICSMRLLVNLLLVALFAYVVHCVRRAVNNQAGPEVPEDPMVSE